MITTDSQPLVRKEVNYTILRILIATLVLGLGLFKLFVAYRGLDQPVAMDQAQIAREVALGNGFSTKFIRPLELSTQATMNGQNSDGNKLDLGSFKDTNYPPLNICAMAIALKVTGSDRFESRRMVANKDKIYSPDRVIAATSLFFFLIALVLGYMLILRLFDETIAATTILLLALSNLMLQYALSGLPQPLMLCFLLGSAHFMLTAILHKRREENGATLLHICLSFLCIALLCLTSWMGLWIALGLIIFCAAYFRPYGSMAIPGLVIVAAAITCSIVGNYSATGSLSGNAYYALYNCFGGGEDLIQRTTTSATLPLNNAGLLARLFGYTLKQLNFLYAAMGSILVTPFFFLCLFNRYKKPETEAFKWVTFSMWLCACVGMAFYGISTPLNASQLIPLFALFFTAYGLSITFNLLARMKLQRFALARNITIGAILLASSGSFMLSIPKEIHRGIWLSDLAHPHYPPYYPAALNAAGPDQSKEVSLVDKTNEQDVVVTDQPWAVAWYANRKAMWIPRRIDDYVNVLEPIITKAGCKVQGFLITPSSHSPNRDTAVADRPGGIKGIISENGDFAPLMLEGSVLLLVPKHNLALADHFMANEARRKNSRPLGTIVSSAGQFPYRHFILGTEMIYYSRQPAK